MRTKLHNLGLLLGMIIAVAVLAGCPDPAGGETTWVYDFMEDGDAVESSSWYVWLGSSPRLEERTYGYWMNQATIAAPYLFTGDFSAEFEFYLKVLPTEDIFRYAFRLVDPRWDFSDRKYCGLAVYFTASPQDPSAYYQIAQGDGDPDSDDISGDVPGKIVNGVSVCRMVKTGSTVTITMNSAPVATMTLDPLNQSTVGYSPMIHGHNSTTEADSNFYVRKLTVTYRDGERTDHDWNE